MPELGMTGPMRKDVLSSAKTEGNHTRSQWEEVAKRYNREFVGSGAECFVVEGENKDKLFAFTHQERSVRQAKMRFYTNKVLKTLFPHNFAHVYASFEEGEDNPERLPGTVRERIYGTSGDKDGLIKKIARDLRTIGIVPAASHDHTKESRHLFNEVEKALRTIGVDLVSFDTNHSNFITDHAGNEVYVDEPQCFFSLDAYEDQILAYMTEHSYGDHDIRVVQSALSRLKYLDGELPAKKLKELL